MTLILPNTYVEKIDTPLIFLAGPIRGAPNWQDQAVILLHYLQRNIAVASPRRGMRDSIKRFVAKGETDYFARQREWERHYLDLGAKTGAIMFWLPGETEHNCEKSYGAMTRMELGQIFTRYSYDPSIRFCIGSDGQFSELSTIAYDLAQDAPRKIFSSLEDTCEQALRLARNIQ